MSHNNAAGGNGDDFIFGTAIDASERIVAAGYSDNGNDFDVAVWLYR